MPNKWRGQEAVIEIEEDGEDVPIGIIDDPEVSPEFNVEELFGAGPITWQDLQRTELRVSVSATVMEWDLDAWKTLTGYDEAEDALPTGPEVPTWTTTVIYTNNDGDEAVFPVQECYTEDVPLGGSREEWIGMDLDFTGKTIEGVDDESDA